VGTNPRPQNFASDRPAEARAFRFWIVASRW